MGVKDYDLNPDNNTQINGINIAEGCPPSGINNAIRQLMADMRADSDAQDTAIEELETKAELPASAENLGPVKVGSGITIAADGTISIDPWNIFPMRVPIAVDGVRFGGSDGRRAIMPGETKPRENWVLCDGGSDGKGGTVPDLRGRMIRGASDSEPAGSTGGSATHTHSLSGTVGETTLTEAQMPSHSHRMATSVGQAGTNAYAATSGNLASTQSTGGSQPHTHALTGASGDTSSLPPYYALSFIMRYA